MELRLVIRMFAQFRGLITPFALWPVHQILQIRGACIMFIGLKEKDLKNILAMMDPFVPYDNTRTWERFLPNGPFCG